MTAQTPHNLINKYKLRFRFYIRNLKLYDVVRGEVSKTEESLSLYKFENKPLESTGPILTCNWMGYVPTFLLSKKGELILMNYGNCTPNNFSEEKLIGNFFIELREHFYAPSLYIPFKNGIINTDTNHWFQQKGYDISQRYNEWSGKYYTKNIIKKTRPNH